MCSSDLIRLAITAFSPDTSFDGYVGGEALGYGAKNTTEGDDTSDCNFVRLSTGSMLVAALMSAFVIY